MTKAQKSQAGEQNVSVSVVSRPVPVELNDPMFLRSYDNFLSPYIDDGYENHNTWMIGTSKSKFS